MQTLKKCNQDIPKSIIAKSFKLGKLIEDETIVYLVKIQTNFVVVPFASLVFENVLSRDLEKHYIARSSKCDQLIEDNEKITW